MKRKRVAFISMHASPLASAGSVDCGGQNVYVNHVARKLADRGHLVDIFTRRQSHQEPDVVGIGDGIRVIHITAGPARFIEKEYLLPYTYAFAEAMLPYVRREAYDLMHANFFLSGQIAMLIRNWERLPFVITFHALGKIRRRFQKRRDRFPEERTRIEREIMETADGIVAECPQDLDDMRQQYAVRRDNVKTIPCGIDVCELYPVARAEARQIAGVDPDTFLVLNVGRIVPRKGLENAIRGFAAFYKRLPKADAKFMIVGGESQANHPRSPEVTRLLGIADELGLKDRIVFPGQVDRENLKYYYGAADVFVTTPWYEPFGITPLEAMACQVPVIGSKVGGIKYSVIDNYTGLLIPAEKPAMLADRLAYLYQSPGLRLSMGLAGYRRVKKRFTWDHVAAALEEFYESTLLPAETLQESAYLPHTALYGMVPQYRTAAP